MQLLVLVAMCCMSVNSLLLAEAGSCPAPWNLSGALLHGNAGEERSSTLSSELGFGSGLRDSASSTGFEDFASSLDSL